MPDYFYKQRLYRDATEVQSFMNGEYRWHMGSGLKIVVREKGEDASRHSTTAGVNEVPALLRAWRGDRALAEPGCEGRLFRTKACYGCHVTELLPKSV